MGLSCESFIVLTGSAQAVFVEGMLPMLGLGGQSVLGSVELRFGRIKVVSDYGFVLICNIL